MIGSNRQKNQATKPLQFKKFQENPESNSRKLNYKNVINGMNENVDMNGVFLAF